METNVSTLLREFPRIRRAALAGEDVIVVTREGDLRITAERPKTSGILGCMKGSFGCVSDNIVGPTSVDAEWNPSL